MLLQLNHVGAVVDKSRVNHRFSLSNFVIFPTTILIMSKLNAGAFEFVPGKGFVVPQPPAQQTPPPTERPEQTEAPRPAPTISLNIGGSKPAPPPVAAAPVSQNQTKAEVKPAPVVAQTSAATSTTSKPTTPAPASKTFSTQKSKTDTTAIAQELKAVADQTVLDDLYGQSMSLAHRPINWAHLIYHGSQGASKYRFHWPCRCREEHHGWKSAIHHGYGG